MPRYRAVKTRVRRGQKVWLEGRRGGANGVITYIDWEDQEAVVSFGKDGGRETLSFDDLQGAWTDSLGGYWKIERTESNDYERPIDGRYKTN